MVSVAIVTIYSEANCFCWV